MVLRILDVKVRRFENNDFNDCSIMVTLYINILDYNIFIKYE